MTQATARNFRWAAALICATILLSIFWQFDSSRLQSVKPGRSSSLSPQTQPVHETISNDASDPSNPSTPQSDSSPTNEDKVKVNDQYISEYPDWQNLQIPLVVRSDKVAVIIESRKLNTLIPLILHFASVLGPGWPVVLYTSAELVEYYENIPALSRSQTQITIRSLPAETSFSTHDSVSAFLTQPWIWESLAPAKHVFMFQADSIICANSLSSVDEYLMYDMVGAPIREGLGRGYNGGLSIRNRELLLQIVRTYDWTAERNIRGTGDGYAYMYEDQWFAMHLGKMPEAYMPSAEVAATFSVETIWADRPVGFHQVSRWLESHMAEVVEYCPEIKLTIGATFG